MHDHEQQPNDESEREATEDDQAAAADDERVITGWGWSTTPGEATQ